jgi:dynein heavy chain
MMQPLLNYIQFECKITSPSNEQNVVMAFLRLWRSLLKVFENEAYGDENDKKTNISIIDSTFLWAFVWSVCCIVDTQYRRPVDLYVKKVCNGEIDNLQKFQGRKIMPGCMDRGTIFDYVYFPEKNEWKNWMELTDKDKIDKFPKDQVVQDIVVTTIDKIRYSYIQEYCINNNIPTLVVGPTGTGKSVYIQNVLLNVLPRDKFLTINIGFSAQTHCNQVQDIVDGKLDKIRTGIFGPRLGMKCVIFVDDLNMPTKEFYGAQPPIEILRQFMAQGGWYDYKDKKHPFRTMQDTIIINAMGPPAGSKSITSRYQRHFNVIAVASFDDNAMKTIFSSILKWYFRTGGFATDVANLETKVVAATLQIYKQI